LTLTANPIPAGIYDYQWNFGVSPVGTHQTLDLTLANPDGVYIVSLLGCAGVSANYTSMKQNLAQSYTILVTKNVDLAEKNTVTGSVGSTASDGKVKIGKKSTISSPGFAKAKKLEIDPMAIVPVQYPGAPVVTTLPTFQSNTTTPAGSDLTISTNSTIAGNYKNVTVKKNVVVTFTTGTIFKKLTLEEGAKATFNGNEVNFESIEMKNGKPVGFGNRTRLNFAGNTSVRVEKGVSVGEYGRINEGGYKITFHVEHEDFRVKGRGCNIVANVYVLNGIVHVHYDSHHNDANNPPTYMAGQFIGKEVHGHEKNTYWNGYNCNADNSVQSIISNVNPDITEIESGLQIKAFPNPSGTYFNLTTITDSKEELHVSMYNVVGLKVQEFKAMPGQIMKLGGHVVAGTYLIEVRQGNERVTVKVVKQ
jgi:hypothetical protein